MHKDLTKERTTFKIVLSLINIIILVWSKSIIAMICSIVLEFLLLTIYGNIKINVILKKMKLPLIYTIIAVLPLALGIKFNPLSFYFDLTHENKIMFFRCFSCMFWLIFLNITTDAIKINSFLRKIKVPDFLIDIMDIMLRFIQIVSETASEIMTSQLSRGGYRGFKRTMHSIGVLMSNLFIKSLKKTKEVSYAMESRGYGNYREVKEKDGDKVFILICILIPAILIAITLGGY